MFNKKLKKENKELKEIIKNQSDTIQTFEKNMDSPLPKECKKGDYCQACMFSKKVNYRYYCSSSFHESYYYVCTKDCCKEFVKKE